MERNPHAMVKVLHHRGKEPTADDKLRYISFHFSEDDEAADVAWTFTIPEGEDVVDALKNYALSMGNDSSDEYVRAFQGHVASLYAQKLLTGSEKEVEIPKEDAKRKSKTPKPAILSPGNARDEEIKLRLRQGQSFLDLASSLKRNPDFIKREAERLLGEDEVKKLMKKNKKGQWSNDEIQHLTSLRKEGLSLAEVTMLLRRTKPSVEKQLRQLENTRSQPTAVEGPQEIPPELRKSLFNTRLIEIWQGLLEAKMAQAWEEALREKPANEWLSSISSFIPDDVKRILGGLQPPTWEELESLPVVDTNDAGVYARLAKSPSEFQTAGDRYLYVGSASKYGGGLNARVTQHMKKRGSKESRLQRDIRKKNLEGGDRFVALMIMKIDSPEKEVVLGVRRTVILAEAILTVWLGALQSPSNHLQSLCPWDTQTLEYTGWSLQNPLMMNVVEPNSEEIS